MSAADVARIAADDCIGCALCLDACPFEAIAGVRRHLHAVLPDLCTGCSLCLPACPVDCIALEADPAHPARDHAYRLRARDRARRSLARLRAREAQARERIRRAHERFRGKDAEARRQDIAAAVAQVRPRP